MRFVEVENVIGYQSRSYLCINVMYNVIGSVEITFVLNSIVYIMMNYNSLLTISICAIFQ